MNPIKWFTVGRVTKTTSEPEATSAEVKKDTGILGSFFSTDNRALSDEKSISKKLLEANIDWVYRNNDVIAKEVGNIEFELFSVGISEGKFVYTAIDDHPLLTLLDKFNETTTKYEGIYTTQSHKKLTGDAFWYLDGKGSDVSNIFILQPDKVELKLGDFTDGSNKLVEAYVYKDVVDGKTIEHTYTPEQIVPFKTPNPNNPYRGYGAVEAAANTIDLDWLTTDLNKKFFQNGAIINFLLTTDSKINQDQLKRLKSEFKSAYAGVRNAFKTIILGGGLKPVPIQMSNKDMDFMAQLEWYRDKIMVIFGNTKASLGIVEDVNRSNAEATLIGWKRNSVKPDMQQIVDTLNEYLVPRYGENLILGFKDPIPEDRERKIAEVKMLVEQKLVSRNEARNILGYDGVDGEEHDEVPIPTIMPPALQNVDTDKVFRQRNLYKKLNDFRRYKEIGKGLAQVQIARQKRKIKAVKSSEQPTTIHERFTNEQVEQYVHKQLSGVEQIEKQLLNKVEQFVIDRKEEVLSNYPENTPRHYNKALFDEDKALVQAELDFAPLLRDIAILAGNEALDLINNDLQYFAFDYEATIRANVRKFTQSMLDTEREKMIDIIKQGIDEGLSIANIRRNMMSAFDELSKIQSERIARTEVIRTSNEASIDAWRESGVVKGKQWFTAEDDRVDDLCAELNGKIVYSLKGNFYSKVTEFDNGNPPIHPNCRCVLLPVLDEDKAFDAVSLAKIQDLESQIDKRVKAYRDLKKRGIEREEYIKELEKLVGIDE